MVKRLTMLMGGLILSTGIALAQTTVTGKVVSQEDGEPVIGASVRIVGTKTGTATDVDGNFTLPNASKDAVLEISYLGMQTKTMKASAKMKIILASDARNLDEVVVTALGMKRSEKTLGYAASTANASELTVAKSGSLMSGLQGKMAGVQISGGGVTGTSQKVVFVVFLLFLATTQCILLMVCLSTMTVWVITLLTLVVAQATSTQRILNR